MRPSYLLLVDDTEVRRLPRTDFGSESELQSMLAEHPELLPLAKKRLAFVGKEISCDAGSIDLLFLDDDAIVTLVETKLLKNPQARREVLAQSLDYAASLVNEWSSRDGRSLESIGAQVRENVRTLVEDDDAVDDLLREADLKLAKGQLRIILALDEAPDRLMRLVQFLNEHSTLEVYVLEVRFYALEGQRVFAPTLIGYKPQEREVTTSATRPDVAAVRSAWDALELEYDTRPTRSTFFQILVDGCNAALHYEVWHSKDRLLLCLHLENRRGKRRARFTEAFAPRVRQYSTALGAEVLFDEDWPQFYIEVAGANAPRPNPSDTAQLLLRFITETISDVRTWGQSNGLGTA